jgi:hypothetical protein
MGLILPRLDDKCLGEDGQSTDPVKLAKKAALIELYSWVYDVGGLVRRSKEVKGKGEDPGIQFIGEFKAHTAPGLPAAIADIWFIAGKAHVPGMYQDVLYAGLVNAQAQDPEATVQFLIRIGIKPPTSDKPSMTGYEWTVQTLVDTDAADSPVDLLFATAKPLQLSAPVVAPDSNSAAAEAVPAGRHARETRQGTVR